MKQKNNFLGKLKRYRVLLLMLLPAVLYVILFNYIPMAGIIVAFKNFNARQGIWKSAFCGLKNFEFLFATPDAAIITRNTILYNLPGGIIFNKLPDVKKLENCFEILVNRHEAFRSYFELEENKVL